MTYTDLIQMLEPIGLPIAEPGVTTRKLPCIAIDPVGMGTADGYSWLYEECDIHVVVPMAQNNAKQFYELHAYTVQVWQQLWGSAVQVDEDGPLYGSTDSDPAQLFFTLSVRFPGSDLCADPLPVPAGLTLTDESGVPIST